MASLQTALDGGPFGGVSLGSGGAFNFATALPLDHTADGSHTAHLKATDKAGNVIGTVTNQAVTLPVRLVDPSCSILHLVIGPIDLNLLGLMVHVSQITIDITANPAGGLLGQLLCDIANLLNNGGPLSQIIADLNQILALLGA